MSVSQGHPTTADAHHAACDELGRAIDSDKMGEIVAKHERLILQYYRDVQKQANDSFDTARMAAKIGFCVLIVTLVYTLTMDGLIRFDKLQPGSRNFMTVAITGAVSGALIEFIAGIAFWLYSRGARQFGAFHICLERTHRYLLAFKITEKMEKRDETLHNLVCIMANAPMITQGSGEPSFRPKITKSIETQNVPNAVPSE
jgi:hypothetical protein